MNPFTVRVRAAPLANRCDKSHDPRGPQASTGPSPRTRKPCIGNPPNRRSNNLFAGFLARSTPGVTIPTIANCEQLDERVQTFTSRRFVADGHVKAAACVIGT